ncbi:MAG: DUF1491 family protein [Alphaproteobacteria bacterium]
MPWDRLPTAMWVSATIRRLSVDAVPAMVVHKGEVESGTLVVKLNLLDGTVKVLTESRGMAGELGWMAPLGEDPMPEDKADAYLSRSVERDPDIWVVEIEDRKGENPFAD